jgi:nicotinamidase-related amidase
LTNDKKTALLLVDWINPFDFEGGESLKKNAEVAVENAVQLIQSCLRWDIPIIFVNDNFHQWSSDHRALCHRAQQPDFKGSEIACKLLFQEIDYFVLKPKHSAFHHTVLELLLTELGVKTLILSGLATNICILFTANDAHLHGYDLYIPGNCSAAETEEDHAYALRHFEKVLHCRTAPFDPSAFPEEGAGAGGE